MLAGEIHRNTRSATDSLAAGERVKVLPASVQTWCLPQVTTVTHDVQLQARYEQRHTIINDVVLRDMLRLRELLLAYRQLVYIEPHQLLKLDDKIRCMDDMVDNFIMKWTFKTNKWSIDSTSKNFPEEFGKLVHEVIKFVASARSVMRYAYSLNIVLERLVQN
ncbi:hypothetical protein PGB90_006277 [Kerria lacca]